MQFCVGPYRYVVRVIGDLVDDEGSPALGLCVPHVREIRLNACLEGEQRREVLFHELRHAWEFHVPAARNAEEDASLFAMMTEQLNQDLDRVGGVRALDGLFNRWHALNDPPTIEVVELAVTEDAPADTMRYAPIDLVYPVESLAPASGMGTSCGMCDYKVAEKAIISSPPKFDPFIGGRVMTRAAYCPICKHVMTWREGVNVDGSPNSSVADGPHFDESSNAVDAFLGEHASAVGIVVE